MANKKKKVGSYKSQLKQQKLMVDSQLVHDSTVLALAASSHTIHAIVPLNSNSNQSPPIVLVTQRLCPRHHIISSPHGSKHQYHGNPFPCINHVFMEDWFDDDDLEDKVVDFDSSSEDSKRGSKIFTSSVVMAPCILVASPVGAQSTPAATSLCVMTSPVEPLDENVSLTTTVSGSLTPVEPFPSSGRNLFASNHNTTSCSKLIHYSAFTETRGCNLVDDDLDTKCDYWKMCLVGYIAGHYIGFKALQNLIDNLWHYEASFTIHDSGWLIFKFANDADKLNVLYEGAYLVYGRSLILKAMSEYFDFSFSDMHIILVWVKFPNLPFKCWSLKCLSKITNVHGKSVQNDMLTSSMSRLSYTRVLVEVNLLSDLPLSTEVTLPNGSLLYQQIYETLP
ncbi:hypothetical protein NC652_034043 [Populus alba x Populus x berolinensis]|nr:hypothetical protein NC652_034043 [Populus alba x Populus x berolinensis]